MAKILATSKSEQTSPEERLYLFNLLNSFGDHYRLSMGLNPTEVSQELEPFENDWKLYNPSKPDYKRYGLSLTSLDGRLTGLPDLTSLYEYNAKNGTSYDESSFTELTPVFEACPSIHELIRPFLPHLLRSHFLRFEKGGYFPYHRDSLGVPEAFRIFVPLYDHSSRDFVFLLGNRKLELENGRPYFINTSMEHALFCFDGPSLHLVLNLRLTSSAVSVVTRHLASY